MNSTPSMFQPEATGQDEAKMVASAVRCMEMFTDRFNARDLVGMDSHLHFPHVILSGAEMIVWEAPGCLPETFFRNLAAETGWSRSSYVALMPVLVSSRKVHFMVEYTRDRADGSTISTHRNLWIATEERGRWAIKLRSY